MLGEGLTLRSEVAYRGVPVIFPAELLLHWEEFTVQIFMEHRRAVRSAASEAELVEALRAARKLGTDTVLARDPERGGVSPPHMDC